MSTTSKREEEADEVRRKLAESGKTLYTLDISKNFASEYLPKQDQQPVKIKKATGKKRNYVKRKLLN